MTAVGRSRKHVGDNFVDNQNGGPQVARGGPKRLISTLHTMPIIVLEETTRLRGSYQGGLVFSSDMRYAGSEWRYLLEVNDHDGHFIPTAMRT